MKALTLLVGGLLLSANSYAQYPVNHQKDRFFKHLDSIIYYADKTNSYQTVSDKISYLDGSGVRDSLRDLQNLFKVYGKKKTYKALDGLYDETKKFEDFISHTRDLRYFKNEARNGNAQARAHYEKLYQEGLKAYEEFLKTSTWFNTGAGGMVESMKKTLNSIAWPSMAEDRDHILKRYSKTFKKYHEKEYPMHLVEDGMHELRRDARRVTYFNYAVNNIVDGDYNMSCPIGTPAPEDVEKAGQPNKYRCYVPQCLLDELRSASSNLSSLKYDALNYELRGEHVPEYILQKAAKYEKNLKDKQVFLHMSQAVKKCRIPSEKEDDEINVNERRAQ